MGFDGLRLQRVVIVSTGDPVEGARIQSVEIYEDGVIVRWVAKQGNYGRLEPSDEARAAMERGEAEQADLTLTVSSLPPEVERRPPASDAPAPPQVVTGGIEHAANDSPDIALRDDVGTSYVLVTASAAGDDRWLRGEEWFIPAIPTTARALIVSFDDASVEIDVTQ